MLGKKERPLSAATKGRGRAAHQARLIVTSGAPRMSAAGEPSLQEVLMSKIPIPSTKKQMNGALSGAALVAAALLMSNAAFAQNARGSATGPTSAPGYDHPGQYMHLQDVKPADNMYPVIQHPEQDKAAQDKLSALQQKTGKKPNILIFLLDDVGWMDPGFNGGGVAVGNATPNMDKLANEGLLLTSAYSTPSCSPSRATIHTGQNPLHHGILRPPMYGEA